MTIKLLGAAQMREIDRYAIEEIGISGAELMYNAASHVAQAAMEFLPDNGRAAVFCAAGNNGGDGIGAAAILTEKGATVRVFIIGEESKLSDDSRVMLERLKKAGGRLEKFADSHDIADYANGCGVIIDAIFGTGLSSNLRGDALKAVRMINESGAKVVCADIASGVQADTGAVLGDAVRGDITVTFSAPKPGHFTAPGCFMTGELRVRDIGIARGLIEDTASDTYAVMPEDISLPRREKDTHKGDYGRSLIVAGSVGYTGAPVLAARAASVMGAGLVFLGVPERIYDICAIKCDEEMPFPLPCDKDGRITANASDEILNRAADCDACLIGPGLGRSPAIYKAVSAFIKSCVKPVVLDADGINALEGNINILDEAACPVILTPHEGEFKRLGADIESDGRLCAARKFAAEHGCVLVLKGYGTVAAFPDGTAYINTTGGPSMAKGGSGDVLAGMITALVGQKFPIKDAVLAAVYLHGLSGDMCAARYGDYSVTAGDIIKMLPEAVKSVLREA